MVERGCDPVSARTKVASLYTDAAEAYEELWAPELLPLARHLLPLLPLREASLVLEVGAGVGALLPDLEAAAEGATVVGSDLSVGMLRRAPARFPRVVADGATLPLPESSVDVAVAAFVLFHLPDPGAGIAELSRVLKPNGAVGSITWGDENDPPSYEIWAEELAAHGAPPPDPDFADFEAVDTPEKVGALMEAHGVRPVESVVREYRPCPSVEEFIAHRTRHGRSRCRFQRLSREAQMACVESARARLEGLPREAFQEVSEVVYVIGRKS